MAMEFAFVSVFEHNS